MAVSAISVDWTGPEIIERGQAQVLTCPVYLSGLPAVPSSGTVTIYDSGNTALVSAAAATITDGVAGYSYTPATTLTPSAGWRVEWTLTISGTVHTLRRDAVLVFRRLYAPEVQEAAVRRHPELSRRLTTALPGLVSEAWAEIEGRLISEGKRPWLILSGPALREPFLNLALSMIFRDLSEGNVQSNDWVLSDKYESLFRDAWQRTTFTQAAEADGTVSDLTRRRSPQSVIMLCGRG